MLLKGGFIIGCLMAIAGCVTPPIAKLSADDLWQDQIFDYQPARITETKDSLEELDPTLAAKLSAAAVHNMDTAGRFDYLINLFFPSGRSLFSYAAGHSRGAAETWRSKSGDCLSLTLLNFVVARTLGIPAQMQEVRVPVAIDRRDNIDFLSGHVNVRFEEAPAVNVGDRQIPAGGFTIDFDPQVGARQRGTPLSEDEILARFFNNRAAEYLAQKNVDMAYAYFKAAIIADPKFAASYSNLAQLYYHRGLFEPAERLLRYAISLNDFTDAPLRTLHSLLVSQGRDAEAKQYAALLKKHEDEDPYFWLGIGLDQLRQSRYAKAIDALERAAALTSGFDEIHRNLAIAYWHNGQPNEAEKQLSLLAAINPKDPEIEAMRKMFRRDPQSGAEK